MLKIKVGDKVSYHPKHYSENHYEIGIVKEIVDNTSIRVVYNCGGDWENYMNYTGCLTNIRDLIIGWYDEKI